MSRIAITLGDPAGIGPEIVAKALAKFQNGNNKFIIVGDRDNFIRVKEALKLSGGSLDGADYVNVTSGAYEQGKISSNAGRIALKSIEAATRLAIDGEVDGICTAPVNKEALLMAGSRYKDHTDLLAALTGSSNVTTVFEVKRLRILFLTKHVSLRDAISSIEAGMVYQHILLAESALSALGVKKRRIAVSALNPHAGEGGLFGSEEKDHLTPAIEKARMQVNVEGPFPADSVYYRCARGEFDIVLSMYHDQGHIAAKMYDFRKTVSMNIGLPFLRTSVDHGTAFDIAGKGVADAGSMLEALKKATKYSVAYRNYQNAAKK